jgi:hypothetical protein
LDNAWWDIEALYEECTKPDLTPGDIVWCITEYNDINPKILVSEREKANEHSSILGRIRTADINSDFNKKDKLPIYNLTLKDTEEIIVKKAKLRPCVILNIIRR